MSPPPQPVRWPGGRGQPPFYRRGHRSEEVKRLALGHTASERQSRDSDTGLVSLCPPPAPQPAEPPSPLEPRLLQGPSGHNSLAESSSCLNWLQTSQKLTKEELGWRSPILNTSMNCFLASLFPWKVLSNMHNSHLQIRLLSSGPWPDSRPWLGMVRCPPGRSREGMVCMAS